MIQTPPLRCPTQPELTEAALALLPRGRAWGTHDGGPYPGSILFGFWSAVGAFFEALYARACALRFEFFCRTHAETNDLWMLEYGLPDSCDPYPDLCSKVTAIGGAKCEDLKAAAAAGGWAINCRSILEECGTFAGNQNARAGCTRAGGSLPAGALIIEVSLSRSTAYVATTNSMPYAGNLRAGRLLSCPPDITPLRCLIDRIAHAHLDVRYKVAA